MRKTTGAGNVSNEFVDKELPSQPTGTRVTADWMNDVQRELIGIQDYAGIAEADGSNKYILSAIKRAATEYGKPVGELFFMDSEKSPSAFDKDSPSDYFPGLCLDTIDGSTDISSTNWPDLVTHLRERALTFKQGITGEKSAYTVTAWSVSSNVGSLTFDNTDGENAILEALTEDQLVHGSWGSFRSITLASAIGNIPAGEYALTDVDPTTRIVTFAVTASDGSGSVSSTATFYTNRVPGSTTTARVYQATGRTLMSANDDGGGYINGLRRRDAMQRITGSTVLGAPGSYSNYVDGVFTSGPAESSDAAAQGGTSDNRTYFDNANSTSPNAAKTDDAETRPKSTVGHIYMWGRSYAA